jgi:hypothetical protein
MKKSNTIKVLEDDVIKFGRVRFRVKKLVVDPADVREAANGSFIRDGGLTTNENEHLSSMAVNDTVMISEQLSQFGRGDSVAGFDNRPLDDNLLK